MKVGGTAIDIHHRAHAEIEATIASLSGKQGGLIVNADFRRRQNKILVEYTNHKESAVCVLCVSPAPVR
jgi:hypothetical protein